jgi:2-keto-4-pentenoate hydratase
MLIDGTEMGAGIAGDILGHPLNALVWLADLRAGQGAPLKAGAFVTLGSMVKTAWVDKGDTIIAEIDGLKPAVLVIG